MPYSMQRYKKRGIRYAGAIAAGRAARAGYDVLMRRYKRARTGGASAGGIATARAGAQSGSGTTVQFDRVRQYRRGRRRPNKRWKRFKRKVKAVINTELGAQTRVFNTQENSSNADPLLNGVFEQHLYPCGTTYADLQTICNELNNGNPTAAAGITTGPTTKLRFRTAIMDMTVRNSSYFTATGGIDSFYGLEVDVYEVIQPRPAREGATAHQSMVTCISGSMSEQKRIGGAGNSVWATALNLPNRGTTPFELSAYLAEYHVKILKKTKYFLNGGATFTYQFKDKRDRYCNLGDIQDTTGFCFKNWTRSVLIFFKMIPGITVGPGPSGVTERLSVGTTRKYLYTYEGQNEAKDRIN
ncbi:MAG: putative capsid protein [Cressdnaviricota sp.]|nr:MAG: putative capsid protein [Cressdnaviricota sp.]